MMSFTNILYAFILPCALSLLCTMVSFGCLYMSSLRYVRKKVDFVHFLLGDFLMVLLFILPQFIVGYFWSWGDSSQIAPVLDTLLIFPSPFLVFFIYYIYRKLFKVPAVYIFQVLELVILGQYICMLVFRLFSDIWGEVLTPAYSWPDLFDADLAAMLTTLVCALTVMLVLQYFIVRRGGHVEIPYGYPEPNIRRELLSVFLVATLCYLVLVGFGLLVFQPRLNDVNFNTALLYGVLLGVLFLFAAATKQRRTIDIKTWQQQAAETYVESVLAATNNVRGLRHDYSNIIQVYNGYIENENFDGLRQYNNTVIRNMRQAQNDIALLSVLRPRTAVYTLLNAKLQLAQDLDIGYSVLDIARLADVKMDDFDFCRILGCTLDNAIEAATISGEKRIRIQVEQPNRLSIILSITNSADDDVDISRLFEPGFTTKEGHEGQGMPSVKRIMGACKNCSIAVNYQYHARLFTISFGLPLI